MSFDDYDRDPIWNEHQWESHLNEIEKRSEQLRKFITSDPNEDVPRWISLLRESFDEMDAVEAFIEEELLFDEAYFPEDEDEWEDDDEDDDFDEDFFFRDELPPFLETDDDDDFDSGEDWKELSDDFTYSDYGSLENLNVYRDSIDLAVDVLKWGESIPAHLMNQKVHEFVSNILKIGAKLAGGYSFGFEKDVLGGNIAYTKKALHSSNEALIRLQHLKGKSYFQGSNYGDIHARLFEIRNDIGIYVQELRDKFRNGIE